MNLLLLLSALFSALTGVGAGAQRLEAAPAIAAQAIAGIVGVEATSPATSRRPPTAPPLLRAVAAVLAPVRPVVAVLPLWADRRRE